MAVKRWSRRGFGCAVEGENCLAVGVRYHGVDRRLSIDEVWAGVLTDKAFTARLARRLGRKALWVPLMIASENERNDIKVCGIDDADGSIRGKRLAAAVDAQLREAEANKSGDYVRTFTRFLAAERRPHTVGASAPRATVDKTVRAWTARGVLRPCVGSVRASVVNLFLALHPAASAAEPVHRLLAYQNAESDLVCYLQGQAFMDSGVSLRGAGVDGLLEHLAEWGSEFAKKYRLTRGDVMRAYVVGGEPFACSSEFSAEEPLEFWPLPWEESVSFASDAVRRTVLDQRRLALPALGLALHGV
jgi:hypothetical protein